MSALVGGCLKHGFFDIRGFDLRTGGAWITLATGESIHIFARFRALMADESALHQTWCCKGASGLRGCCECLHTYSADTPRPVLAADPVNAVLSTCMDPSRFTRTSRPIIMAILARLSEIRRCHGAADLNEAQTRLGWSIVDGSIMMDPELDYVDPSSQTLVDTMHILFSSGIVAVHIGQLMKALKRYKFTYDMLHEYALLFKWPRRVGYLTGVKSLSQERAHSSWEAGRFKAQASESMSILPVIANFIQNVLVDHENGTIRAHAACFMKLMNFWELIDISARYSVTAAEVQSAAADYGASFKELYGEDCMIFKFHMMFHLSKWLDIIGFLPNCQVLERKHRVPKRYADQCRNTRVSTFASSVLREVTVRHLAVLEDAASVHFQVDPCLQNPHPPSKLLDKQLRSLFGDADYIVLASARINEYEVVQKGDVVMIEEDGAITVGAVVVHISATTAADPLTLVTKWINPIIRMARAARSTPCMPDGCG